MQFNPTDYNLSKRYKSFAEFQKDFKTKGAVKRHLGIIGEAVHFF